MEGIMEKKCPICNRFVNEDILEVCQEAEDWILQSIRRAHPDWVEKDGTCSRCISYYKSIGKLEEET